jgi:hypothetical protein
MKTNACLALMIVLAPSMAWGQAFTPVVQSGKRTLISSFCSDGQIVKGQSKNATIDVVTRAATPADNCRSWVKGFAGKPDHYRTSPNVAEIYYTSKRGFKGKDEFFGQNGIVMIRSFIDVQ